jgi:hypothetical protein
VAKLGPDQTRQKPRRVSKPVQPAPWDAAARVCTTRVFPMQLQIGDRMTDSTAEWKVVGRPYTTAGEKNAHVRVQRVNRPGVMEIRSWGTREKVSVRRA